MSLTLLSSEAFLKTVTQVVSETSHKLGDRQVHTCSGVPLGE